MGKILGIDFGQRKVGVAINDATKTLASSLRVICYTSLEKLIDELRLLCVESDIERIVVGYPISMRGNKTQQTLATEFFLEILRQGVSMPVETLDERLTTVQARKIIQSFKRRGPDDLIAAQILLQTYLDKTFKFRNFKNGKLHF